MERIATLGALGLVSLAVGCASADNPTGVGVTEPGQLPAVTVVDTGSADALGQPGVVGEPGNVGDPSLAAGTAVPVGDPGNVGDPSLAAGTAVPADESGVPQSPGVPGAGPAAGADASGLGTVPIEPRQAKSLSRLTNHQFITSAKALVGEASVLGVEALLPDVIPNGGFGNAGYAQARPYDLIEGYDTAARQIVANLTDWPAFHARWGGCGAFDCAPTFIQRFGQAAFRRPLADAEVQALSQIVTAGQDNQLSYDETVGLLIQAVLQAPEFLYLLEDDTLSGYQLATRLSYFVSDGPPDDELYAAAPNLAQPEVLSAQLQRLQAQLGEGFGRAFAYDYLTLRRAYQRPFGIEDAVVDDLVASALDSFSAMVSSGESIGSLLTTPSFSLNPTTTQFLAAPSIAAGGAAAPSLMGLLTHPATLLAVSNAVEGSTVSRGQFLASTVLCLPPVPPPPAAFAMEDLSGVLPPDPTQRDEAEARLADPRCGSCHSQFENFAFAFNRWGGDGVFKDDVRLRDDGSISTPLGQMDFSGYADFLPLLAQSEQFQLCLTSHVVRYGLRHAAFPSDLINTVLNQARSTGQPATFQSLASALVQQPVFSIR